MHGRGCFVAAILFAAFSFMGCKAGPTYCPPEAHFQNDWIDASHPRLIGQVDDPVCWWAVFQDDHITQLIRCALDQNLTLKQAGWRIAEARFQRQIAAGGLFPQDQAASGLFNHRVRSLNNANTFPGITQRSFDQIALGLTAAWEIDFWGRFRRSIEAADAELDASIEDYNDALVILLGDVAEAYIDIRTLEKRMDLARRNAQIQHETLALVEKKYAAGLVSELDVAQAQVNLYQTEAIIPTLEIRHRQASNLLCILMGMPPADLASLLDRTGQIPVPPGEVAVGIPADLLRQRPDIRRAERQLAAQSARIGIAQSDFYPHISITGTLYAESRFASTLFSPGSLASVAGPNFRWDILNYGRIKNNVLLQDAKFQRLAVAYQQSILDANRQVEDGMVAFFQTHEQIAVLERTVQASTRSMELSVLQYRAGTTDFNRVFQSQTEQVKQQDQLATSEGELAKSLVAIYRALGGGWQFQCFSTSVSLQAANGVLPPSSLIPAYDGLPVE